MSNVIEFKRPEPPAPPDVPPHPLFTIAIYDNPADAGFEWRVFSVHGDLPDRERLQDYVGDMFMSLCPDEPPSILQRLETFIRNLFNRSRP